MELGLNRKPLGLLGDLGSPVECVSTSAHLRVERKSLSVFDRRDL
jgi:hypothetical protein